MQLLFEQAHEPYGDYYRNNVSLIAGQVDLVQTEPYDSLWDFFAVFEHTRHAPRVYKVCMHHYHAYDRAEEDVSAENTSGRYSDKYRKEYKRCVAEEVEYLIRA